MKTNTAISRTKIVKNPLMDYLAEGAHRLVEEDPELGGILNDEYARQLDTLYLVASASGTDNSVMAAEGSPIVNITAEGYPEKRFHAGCENVDRVEMLAIERAKKVFHAQYANVQAHCASFANQIVMHALLSPGDTILGMDLGSGGHLSHGSKPNISGRIFKCVHYGLDRNSKINFSQVEELALEHKPKLIICGTSGYSRDIPFAKFREIADKVGAYVLADVTHIAGLIATGELYNPIDDVHLMTMCTFKQLYGPRGGLILSGKDAMTLHNGKTIAQLVQQATFPLVQGSPMPNNIAGKARAFHRILTGELSAVTKLIKKNAVTLAGELTALGYNIVSDGTDNHIVMINLGGVMTGYVAEKALEECGVIANKNIVPNDPFPPMVTGGLRFGTNTVALRKIGPREMKDIALLINMILKGIIPRSEKTYELPEYVKIAAKAQVAKICSAFKLPYDYRN